MALAHLAFLVALMAACSTQAAMSPFPPFPPSIFPWTKSPPPAKSPPALAKSPPPLAKSPPPLKKSPPPLAKSPPPLAKSPPPLKKSPPLAKSPPPLKKSPPAKSPPPLKKSPPAKSPPPLKKSPPLKSPPLEPLAAAPLSPPPIKSPPPQKSPPPFVAMGVLSVILSSESRSVTCEDDGDMNAALMKSFGYTYNSGACADYSMGLLFEVRAPASQIKTKPTNAVSTIGSWATKYGYCGTVALGVITRSNDPSNPDSATVYSCAATGAIVAVPQLCC